MANRSFYNQVRQYDRELVTIVGTISINASNAVTSHTLTGVAVGGIARTAAGTYQITLTDTFPSLKMAQFTIFAATAVDRFVQVSTVNTTTTRIIEIKELAGGVATDVGAAHSIFCHIVLSNV